MRVLDPRLVRRARAVRSLLVADSLLGIVIALLVLAQAVLLARVAARAFAGASLSDVSLPLVLFVAVVVARAVGVWGFEVAGRRAASDVISQLRLDLVETRLRRSPAALDGVQSAEVATAAVSGVDALETTFTRYLPQVVLAAVVPVAVLVLVAWIDLLAAGVMLLTLPLVPVFMWLVGRYTAARAQERWQALALLSNHFLDVVRGLPTLRAFNRAHAQVERIAEVSDEYRRTTMGTLRLAFLSGSILDLAATLGIALVAVVVGVRLAEGGIALRAGADDSRARTRALSAASQSRCAVPRERRRDGGRGADARPFRRRTCDGRVGGASGPVGGPRDVRAGFLRLPDSRGGSAGRRRSRAAAW